MSAPPQLLAAPIPPPVRTVVATLRDAGFPTYLVGGCVRDMLRGVAPKDFDVATGARPEEVQRSFRKVLPTGLQHGTVTVLLQGTPVEVTTFRSEGVYLDGRHPSSVSFHTDVVADLARRDFTINAMAFDPEAGALVDPFGGQEDLAARVVRCVGSPDERFGEDGLRPLRAVRFATVLDFELEAPTEQAIRGALPVFARVALERVTEELKKVLLSPHVARGLMLLTRTGLLDAIFPGLRADSAVFDAVRRCPPVLEVRLGALLGALETPEAMSLHLERLKLPRKTMDRATLLAGHLRLAEHADASDPALRRLLVALGPANVEDAVGMARAVAPNLGLLPADADRVGERLRALVAAKPPLSPRELALNGGAIMRILDVGPSPIVGEATRHLMDVVLDEPSRNQPDVLEEALRTWAAARGRAG
ncbi:MAG: [cytidine(C)-cytidine(C)-adenosine (A)]-adding enzyme [Myxococcaceae bacterium]|nr:[cytidine(C)-cytidine(C)-adenosine (A)]-adding enzyme [Myxococcaceae bacterium]MCI0669010.1 [cytidine(C)-cytidine(C)-adenosine (A)]-adding enzyme [Myxococcaceae bacterium]